ncbi:hypothetical protein QUF58_08435 [Anaerolineales bacterium HSG24]|nr:hypothetical protein [Anaerolineales bacterium HSG24]
MKSKKRQNKKQRHAIKRKQRKKQLSRKKQLKQGSKQTLNHPNNIVGYGNADLSKYEGMLAATTTGEHFQPVRLHYTVPDTKRLIAIFDRLKCIDYDKSQKRWVWLLSDEAKDLKFKKLPPEFDDEQVIIIGEFLIKDKQEVVLNLRSHERALIAIEFFDQHIPRDVAKLTDMTTINRLFNIPEMANLVPLDNVFNKYQLTVTDPDKMIKDMEAIAERASNQMESITMLNDYLAKREKQPEPIMEKRPLYFYEDGISSIKLQLKIHHIVSMKHWTGNTDYTTMDAIREMSVE